MVDDDYESGPYCRHWAELWDCDEVCARCGHRCDRHVWSGDQCEEAGCSCDAWVESPPPPPKHLHQHVWQPIAGGLMACVCGAVAAKVP